MSAPIIYSMQVQLLRVTKVLEKSTANIRTFTSGLHEIIVANQDLESSIAHITQYREHLEDIIKLIERNKDKLSLIRKDKNISKGLLNSINKLFQRVGELQEELIDLKDALRVVKETLDKFHQKKAINTQLLLTNMDYVIHERIQSSVPRILNTIAELSKQISDGLDESEIVIKEKALSLHAA